MHLGPQFGYFPKAAKICVIVKPQFLDSVKEIFKGSGIQVKTHGHYNTQKTYIC